MKAMILAAGEGRRLAPLTDRTPKPLLPVQGQPLIAWQLSALSKAGISQCVINTYHLGQQIIDYVGDGSAWNMQVQFSEEVKLLETGGGLVNALPLLGDEPFLVVNGDIWTDFDFTTLRPPAAAPVHLVLTPKPSWREAGDFEYADGRVTGRGDTYVYCGISVVQPAALAGRDPVPFSFRDVLFALIESRQLTAQTFDGTWYDIGTPEQYADLV